jgi:hypothetical protein
MPSHPRFVGCRWRRGGVRRMHSVDKILQAKERIPGNDAECS